MVSFSSLSAFRTIATETRRQPLLRRLTRCEWRNPRHVLQGDGGQSVPSPRGRQGLHVPANKRSSARLKPANKQYTSLSHEFELTFGNVTVEACDDDAGISQIKGDWQPLSIFGDGGGPRDGNIDVVAIVRKAEPVGTIISFEVGQGTDQKRSRPLRRLGL